jgi:hypothetical protein
MITPEEAVALTTNTNNEIAKKVDEILNNDIDACIRAEAARGNNEARYYFRVRREGADDTHEIGDPIVKKFTVTIARSIQTRLMEMGWDSKLIPSARNGFDIVGVAIYW